jgi:NAD(P)-dependent dehydrogenase (short-subunit alcohol dehydrogenase family)
MKKLTVITGGAGGIHHVVISDVNPKRLETAVAELTRLGVSCNSTVCDIIDRNSVDALIKGSLSLGKLVSVIHTAGISPQMADAKTIIKVNALGTVNVTDACRVVADEGFALVNVASMAAHMMPALLLPKRAYPLALTDPDRFLKKTLLPCRLMPKELYRNGLAYGISKHFVIWFSKKSAADFGRNGARVVSVSPGTFDTEMGRLEEKSGSAEMLKTAALKRFGKPEEIAEVLAFCASEKAGYLTGTDILCDGGVVAGRELA